MQPSIDVEISYSLGMEPSDVSSEEVGGGGLRCRLVSNLLTANITRLHTQAIRHV